MEHARPTTVQTGSIPLRHGAASTVVAGTVRRLEFVPDGGEGYLIAQLDDGTRELEVRLPRRHAGHWAPGAEVVAEGATHEGAFAVRAYLAPPDRSGLRVWVEVAPPATPER